MPSFTFCGRTLEYADEAELLSFANKLRAAGEADPLEALMPSVPGDANACLIANAVNFQSEVDGVNDGDSDNDDWYMFLPSDMETDRALRIAAAIDCELLVGWEDPFNGDHYLIKPSENDTLTCLMIKLPERIGNAARAFDKDEGWTSGYNKENLTDL